MWDILNFPAQGKLLIFWLTPYSNTISRVFCMSIQQTIDQWTNQYKEPIHMCETADFEYLG